ncbi:MAG: sugar transferase [Fibrobacteria bacterium]|nr:sugar transferase [Fibrobacteria bacterium]
MKMKKQNAQPGVPTPTIQITKRLIDIVSGLVGFSIFLLTFPLIALLIKLDSPGPVLYRQQRVGRNNRSTDRRLNNSRKILVINNRRSKDSDRRQTNICGKVFMLYKYRTMRSDAEKNGPQLCQIGGGDPRITRIGKWLRYFHLDELPQFTNILKGEMSLIGARPERPFFTEKYNKEIPHYMERMRYVKPGLTGLAQITLGYDESLQTVMQKYYYDITYRISMTSFRSWFRMEMWIFLNTFRYLWSQVCHASVFKKKERPLVHKVVNIGGDTQMYLPVLHIAHPWKLIERINKNQIKTDEKLSSFIDSLDQIHIN